MSQKLDPRGVPRTNIILNHIKYYWLAELVSEVLEIMDVLVSEELEINLATSAILVPKGAPAHLATSTTLVPSLNH